MKFINEQLLSGYIKSYINLHNIFNLANKFAILVTIVPAFILICKILFYFFLTIFKPDDRSDNYFAKCVIIESKKCSYFRDFRKTMASYIYEIGFVFFLMPLIIIVCVYIMCSFYDVKNNSCNNMDLVYILLILLVLIVVVRCVNMYAMKVNNIKKNVLIAMLILVCMEGSTLIISEKNVFVILGILSYIWAIFVSSIIHNELIKNTKVTIFFIIKYLILLPIYCYDVFIKMSLFTDIITLWGILTLLECFLKLCFTCVSGKVFLYLKSGERHAVKKVFEAENSIVYVDEIGKHYIIDKSEMAYISHNYDLRYRHFIYKNRSMFCKFVDGKRYEFGDYWVDRNGYAHLIKNSGGEIYICKCEKIEERYRR